MTREAGGNAAMPHQIINVTAALEEILADVVGQQPEKVQLADWGGIARRMQMLLEQKGLHVALLPSRNAQSRFMPPGPFERDEAAVILIQHKRIAIVKSTGAPLDSIPWGLAVQLWHDMFEDGLKDLRGAQS